jgi:dolichyl-phosphate beta-glucosyltransferase
MNLSIVIPVWNESGKIISEIEAAILFLEMKRLSGEVIISDDGSRDGTVKAIENWSINAKLPVRVLQNQHLGKGNAVRKGILEAKGDIVLFIDSGNCIPYEDVWEGIQLVDHGECEIANGSRYLPDSRILIPKGWIRRILSFSFRKFVCFYMHIPAHLTDTQCGLKIYRKDVAHTLYSQCFTQGFIFDIEIILRAQQKGYSIREFPVRWSSDPDSRLFIFRSFPGIFRELRRIKRELTLSSKLEVRS